MKRSIPVHSVAEILLIRKGGIGDVLMATPAFSAIRKKYPRAHITLLTTPTCRPLFENDPRINHVMEFDWPAKKDAKHARRRIETFGLALRGWHYDLVIDLRGDSVTSAIVGETGAHYRVGFHSLFCNFRHGFRYNVRAKSPSKRAHRTELANAVLKPIGVTVDERMKVYVSEKNRMWAKKFLIENGVVKQDVMVIHPTSTNPEKCWSVEKYHQVAQRALARGMAVVVVGTPQDKEAYDLLEKAKDQLISAVGCTTTAQLAALIEAADVFVGNDSGPMHMAASVGTPTVSIFVGSDLQRYRPLGDGHIALMGGVEPDVVWNAVATTIGGSYGDFSAANQVA